jgi:transcription initiation factor TFIIIB Brf1 subunit/transcription initiation factor TFIIB
MLQARKKSRCPECGSADIFVLAYRGTTCVVCGNCGFDERDEIDVYPEQRVSQREKSRYTPYKKGGGRRSQKT